MGWTRLLLRRNVRVTVAVLSVVSILVALLVSSNPSIGSYSMSSLETLNGTMVDVLMRADPEWKGMDTGTLPEITAAKPSEDSLSPTALSNIVNDDRRIIVLEERNLAKDYTGQTEFSATYFGNSPSCSPISSEEVSFTLTTQASLDRLWIMKYHCQRWAAPLPISVAVYLPANSEYNVTYIVQELDQTLDCVMDRMTVTILRGQSTMDLYPVNLLRNLAIQEAKTSHVLYIDSDFLISDRIHDNLMTMAPVIANDSKAAVVVPAFTYFSGCQKFSSKDQASLDCLESEWSNSPTLNKRNLEKLWQRHKTVKPNMKPGFHGIHFHSTTLYSEWKNQTGPLRIPCLKSYLYEPYLAVRLCNELVEFPPIFRGYGWNKNVWIQWLLFKLGYNLWQLPGGFVFHMPHSKSAGWKSLKNETELKRDPDYGKYIPWLKKVPPHPDMIPGCPGHKVGGNRKGHKKKQKAKKS